MWSTPLHLEASEEEIFYVLDGTGVSVQWDGSEEAAYAVGAGDCLVHLALEHAHTLQAGPEGLDVLAFGERHYAANTFLPRAGVSWLGATWVLEGAPDDHPWKREAAAGPPEVGELAERPARIVNVADVEPETRAGTTVDRDVRDLAQAADSIKTGLRLFEVRPGKLVNPPHCHTAEEEIFVVLEGDGTLEVWPHLRRGGEHEVHARARGERRRAPGGDGSCAHLPGGGRRPDAARLRDARADGRHLLPTVGQGELPRPRSHRPSGRARLLGWRGLSAVEGLGWTVVNEAWSWVSSDCVRAPRRHRHRLPGSRHPSPTGSRSSRSRSR